jgi:outer membrane biosynthesis protein TonB
MDKNEKKDKGIAIGGTILVHALAVLILFLMAFRTPLPLPGEEGVEVNLGYADEGLGEIQPEKPASPTKSSAPPQQQETSNSEEENITEDNSENPAINEPKKTKTKTEPKQEKKTEQPKQKSNPRAEFKSNNNDLEESSESNNDLTKLTISEGNTKGANDQGKKNGSKDGKSPDGNGGQGNNITSGYEGSRGVIHREKPKDDFDHVGNIVVDIYINSKGDVERAELNRKYTTITETTPNAQKMRKEAIEVARKWHFKPDSNAHELEHGTITFSYTLN